MRDPDHERALQARRLLVERVQRRRREGDGHAVRAAEHVLRVPRRVRRRAARDDQDVVDVVPVERLRELRRARGLPLEQACERLGLLAELVLKPGHGSRLRR